MPTEVDWSTMGTQQSGGGGKDKKRVDFIKFTPGKEVTVRPIGAAIAFYKFFHNKRSVVVDPEVKDQAAATISAHAGEEIIPQQRFAINVIDRSDGKFKVLENGQMIFNNFGVWSRANGNSAPGSNQGCDWTILPQGVEKGRKYTVMPGPPRPFSTDEIKRAKEQKELYSLKEVFVACPVDQVVERLFGGGKKNTNVVETSASPETEMVGSMDDPSGW